MGHSSGTSYNLKSKMDESELQENVRDRCKNIQFTQDIHDIVTCNVKEKVEQMSEIENTNVSTTVDTDNNGTKAKCGQGDIPHVHSRNDNKTQTATSALPNIEHSAMSQAPVDNKSDALVSPETPTKRKRVHHDYRRLSSSGYVDDYERSGRERFSNANEKEFELLEKEMNAVTPTPPKPKVAAKTAPKSPDIIADTNSTNKEGSFITYN